MIRMSVKTNSVSVRILAFYFQLVIEWSSIRGKCSSWRSGRIDSPRRGSKRLQVLGYPIGNCYGNCLVCCDLLIALNEVIPIAADPNAASRIAGFPIAASPISTSLIELDSDSDYRSLRADLTRGEFDWMD
jgi:hypothetical protein